MEQLAKLLSEAAPEGKESSRFEEKLSKVADSLRTSIAFVDFRKCEQATKKVRGYKY